MPSAPLTLAIASVVFAEEPAAVKPTAPPAVTFRSVPAVTASSTIASASARPIATEPPVALASAFEDVDAVCVAETETAPLVVRPCVVSPASFALVVHGRQRDRRVRRERQRRTGRALRAGLGVGRQLVRRRRRQRHVLRTRDCAPESRTARRHVVDDVDRRAGADPTVPAPVSFAFAFVVLSTDEVAVSETSDAFSTCGTCSTSPRSSSHVRDRQRQRAGDRDLAATRAEVASASSTCF